MHANLKSIDMNSILSKGIIATLSFLLASCSVNVTPKCLEETTSAKVTDSLKNQIMKKLMVWITVDSKDGMRDKVIEILDEPFGNTFTANQNGCERLERSLDNQNHNRLFLTELWSSREDWDTYFENGTKLRDENGFNKRLGELLKEDGIQIIFSDINKLPL